MNIILEGIVGSQAYGTSTVDSDVDYLGIYQLDTRTILGRWGDSDLHQDTKTSKNPDRCYHELGKYLKLASECNPTVLELLFLPQHTKITANGYEILDNKLMFLSQQARVRYCGYAKGQVYELVDKGSFKPKYAKRPEKHGRHCARLLIQLRQILLEGTLDVRLTPEQAAWSFECGELAKTNPVEFAYKMADEILEVEQLKSDLPEKTDVDKIRDLLVHFREQRN